MRAVKRGTLTMLQLVRKRLEREERILEGRTLGRPLREAQPWIWLTVVGWRAHGNPFRGSGRPGVRPSENASLRSAIVQLSRLPGLAAPSRRPYGIAGA